MNKMNIKLINMVMTNLVALTGERTTSSFIMSSRRFLCESFFKDSRPIERKSGRREKKTATLSLRFATRGYASLIAARSRRRSFLLPARSSEIYMTWSRKKRAIKHAENEKKT